jgi:hypothetical protein
MKNEKKSVISIEVDKYPYSGISDDTEHYLSNKICRYNLTTIKKIIKKSK